MLLEQGYNLFHRLLYTRAALRCTNSKIYRFDKCESISIHTTTEIELVAFRFQTLFSQTLNMISIVNVNLDTK